MKKLSIALIGCGQFAQCFVPLFKAHPYVEKIEVCDIIPERAQDYAKRFEVNIVSSFEEALKRPDFNTVAIFTQRHLHGPMVIAALKAGKHVYSAVPTGLTVDEIGEIEALVRKTGLCYATGETGFYRACTVFCREKFMSGEMGNFVYAEAQYNHDMRNMWYAYKYSGGEDWKKYAGFPPMYYPTHSTSMVLGCMPGVYVKRLSAYGYEDPFRKDAYGLGEENFWHNPFANTAMLCELSNGGLARISENRTNGWRSPESYITCFNGTDGSYEFSVANHHYAHWKPFTNREDPCEVTMTDVSDLLLPERISAKLKVDRAATLQDIANGDGFMDTSPIQNLARLPKEFEGLANGHNGCHHFMVDDFCKAAYTGKLAPTNIWQAARFNIPGLIAHESALKHGIAMDVPDLGDPPKDWELLLPDGVYGTQPI